MIETGLTSAHNFETYCTIQAADCSPHSRSLRPTFQSLPRALADVFYLNNVLHHLERSIAASKIPIHCSEHLPRDTLQYQPIISPKSLHPWLVLVYSSHLEILGE
jgi:hypothetical protein